MDIQDAERIQIAHRNNSKISNSTLIKDMFYEKINKPLQTQCKILKKVGGSWRSNSCGFVNGEKMVCMDIIYEALKNDSCLIYSFGLSDNWDFEIAMAELGKGAFTYYVSTFLELFDPPPPSCQHFYTTMSAYFGEFFTPPSRC